MNGRADGLGSGQSDPAHRDARARRIDWLDGWRAIAVTLVVISHFLQLQRSAIPFPGKLGVYVFFAISGFIVTRLLVRERRKSGRVDIGAFYIRRVARILPPLVIYLGACLLIGQGTVPGALRALSFTCNIARGPGDCGWTFGHTWSLAFEEQYYLIVPFLLAVRSGAAIVPGVLLALLPFLFPVLFIGRIGAIQIYLLLGLGACVALHEDRILPRLARLPAPLCLALLALSGVWIILPPGPIEVVTGLLVPIAIIAAIFGLPANSALARTILSSRPMRTIGLYSYTFYLWQQLALTDPPLLQPVLGLALALGWAALSYHTLERWTRDAALRFCAARSGAG